jgi:hypothetical protein
LRVSWRKQEPTTIEPLVVDDLASEFTILPFTGHPITMPDIRELLANIPLGIEIWPINDLS